MDKYELKYGFGMLNKNGRIVWMLYDSIILIYDKIIRLLRDVSSVVIGLFYLFIISCFIIRVDVMCLV